MGRVHYKMEQRRLAKSGPVGRGMAGMNASGLAQPLGLVGLVGAGVLGYSLLKKKGGGFSSFGGLLPSSRAMTGFPTTAGISPTLAAAPLATATSTIPITTAAPIAPTMPISAAPIPAAPVAAAAGGGPIVHNRKLPLRERAIAKITGRPVVTNYR